MDLANASTGRVHASNALAENMERFQSRKIEDIKSILNEMIYSEMQYHAKGTLAELKRIKVPIFFT
jgi:hypothetical protein